MKFIAGMFCGLLLGGAVLAAADEKFDQTRRSFVFAGGEVAKFASDGKIIPREPGPLGQLFPISMTPTGEVACADHEVQAMLDKIMKHFGIDR